jgi:cytoplasmic iron level regulating protein YaaA (DUF328/UPF0246 family)
MLILISPAKTLDFETPVGTGARTQPEFLADAGRLVTELRELAPHELARLMSMSDKLGLLNYDRYQSWQPPFTGDNARQALLAFKGDVYTGMQAGDFTAAQLKFAQRHLRILSGLYGLLRPLDLIQPYRLEMGTRLANERGRDLYQFWHGRITAAVNRELDKTGGVLVNLASKEYFKSVAGDAIGGRIVTPVFKDRSKGSYKVISFYAKRARGMMVSYIVRRQLTLVEDIQSFDLGGYRYRPEMSSPDEWTFTREAGPGAG